MNRAWGRSIVLPMVLCYCADLGLAESWTKQVLSRDFVAEGAVCADLNRDGHNDLAAGPYWYEGPGFEERHVVYEPKSFDPLKYSDNFLAFAHDFDADGWVDVLVVGFPGAAVRWYENPGKAKRAWIRHEVAPSLGDESPAWFDLLGTRRPVLVGIVDRKLGYLDWSPTEPERPWVFHAISPAGDRGKFTHGLGCGDLNGDGRADILEKNGWWEQPRDLDGDPVWDFHPMRFAPGQGGAQMVVVDLNEDGRADVVTAKAAHGYGISWFEQTAGDGGRLDFIEHVILPETPTALPGSVQFSQPHALAVADVNNDGRMDLVTGKRWWAHGPHGDAEPNVEPVLFVFEQQHDANGLVRFAPRLVDRGVGIGTQVVVGDADGDPWPDVMVANKRGVFVFRTQPQPSAP